MADALDINVAVDAIIGRVTDDTNSVIAALRSGGQRMLAAASALEGQPADHPDLALAINKLTQAEADLSTQVKAELATFQAASDALASKLPVGGSAPPPAP